MMTVLIAVFAGLGVLVIGIETIEKEKPVANKVLMLCALAIAWLFVSRQTASFNDEVICTGKVTSVSVDDIGDFQVAYDGEANEFVNVSKVFGKMLPKGSVVAKKQIKGKWHLGVFYEDDRPRWVVLDSKAIQLEAQK